MEPPSRDVRRFAAEPHFDPDTQPTSLDGGPPTSFAACISGQFPASLLESVDLPAGNSLDPLQALLAQHQALLAERPLPELLDGASMLVPPLPSGEFATPVTGDTDLLPSVMKADSKLRSDRRDDD
ncbi:MAG: hypothetical protein QGE96_02505 [Candidatus Poseidoniia archaeon]|jgi:hypothetical protein|nr:hypothetical protein [Candidatus Poseidoniia archaeon]MDP7474224.1 hypothetical protein [Candidatus Poseidoniia archaeon]MDP7538552.1 hypothetical protein [Candidatus Poseidoniia archaeon]MDP7589786.1 hypothetical protein [Candidatus Poseidoniia archaeon]HJO28246.1 hypothetical protein [Candidatus Poseidoniia archaeon]|tara:strand:+ start:181 stop:558 length:378 start_codon:yes stop_codon:yes gene_type:complete